MHVDTQVGRRARPLDQRRGATDACAARVPFAVQQVARDHAPYHLQHQRYEVAR